MLEQSNTVMRVAYTRYYRACEEVSNDIKCGIVLGILINNMISMLKLVPAQNYSIGLIISGCYTHSEKLLLTIHTTANKKMQKHLCTLFTDMDYRKFSNIRRTKSPNSNVSRLVLQLSLFNPMKPGP